MTYQDLVATEIRVTMARRHWNQAELARRLGVSEQWVSTKLRGKSAMFVNDLERIAQALNVPMPELLPDWDAWCAARDSDPQPADWEFAQVIPLRRSDVGHIVRRVA